MPVDGHHLPAHLQVHRAGQLHHLVSVDVLIEDRELLSGAPADLDRGELVERNPQSLRGARPCNTSLGGQMGGTRGKGVFLSAGCGACHTFAAAGTKATVGPNLDTSLKGKTNAFVRQSILDPNATIAPGYQKGVMPTTYQSQLTMRQIAELVAFLLKSQK
jgi:mono/diheme cytochrome c family protein